MRKSQTRLRASAVLVLGALTMATFAGCASPGKDTAIGAGAGALGGGVLGAVIGGKNGALIGAAAGGIIGGTIGNRLDRQAQELKKVAETKRTKDGILVKLKGDLLFDSGSAVLKPEANDQLAQLGDIMAKYPGEKLRVEGYTDSTGSVAKNEELSKRRADSVRDILVNRGLQPAQVLVAGMGKNNPVGDNRTPAGRATNRRVELHITIDDKDAQKK